MSIRDCRDALQSFTDFRVTPLPGLNGTEGQACEFHANYIVAHGTPRTVNRFLHYRRDIDGAWWVRRGFRYLEYKAQWRPVTTEAGRLEAQVFAQVAIERSRERLAADVSRAAAQSQLLDVLTRELAGMAHLSE